MPKIKKANHEEHEERLARKKWENRNQVTEVRMEWLAGLPACEFASFDHTA